MLAIRVPSSRSVRYIFVCVSTHFNIIFESHDLFCIYLPSAPGHENVPLSPFYTMGSGGTRMFADQVPEVLGKTGNMPFNPCPVLLSLCLPTAMNKPLSSWKTKCNKRGNIELSGKNRKHSSSKWVWSGLLFCKWDQICFVPFLVSLLYQEWKEARDLKSSAKRGTNRSLNKKKQNNQRSSPRRSSPKLQIRTQGLWVSCTSNVSEPLLFSPTVVLCCLVLASHISVRFCFSTCWH